MKTLLKQITPKEAELILGNNKHNRPVNKTRVGNFAHIIKSGKWRVTHQGICIDKNNNLLDGQHRLKGCVEAKKPIRVYVTTGADPEIFSLVDNGMKRSPGATLAVDGFPYYTEIATLVGTIKKMERNWTTQWVENVDVLDYARQNKEYLTGIVSKVKSEKNSFMVCSKRVFLFWLMDQNNLDLNYYEKLVNGTSNKIINNFRDQLIDYKIKGVVIHVMPFVNMAILNYRSWKEGKYKRYSKEKIDFNKNLEEAIKL